ncbi:hypothetical protein H5410_005162 [Solanum commersonii]|uniref:CSD domain-containing protein n=1 Tax=Solanum commersonii TaxID=4109 RepID=A0A9J6A6E2_SOLCO|nr:hypothetical protein H5410_005162 [Solanum commersonii]
MCNQGHRNTKTVKLFSDQKGLCFITPNDGADEIFINQSAIRSDGFRSLVNGEVADFDMEPGMLVALRRYGGGRYGSDEGGYGCGRRYRGDGIYVDGGGKCGGGSGGYDGGGGGGGGCSKYGEGGHL